MAAVRRNILNDATARQQYIDGVRLLKQEFLGPTTSDLGISGSDRPISTYDLFVVWHHVAMTTFTHRLRPTATPPIEARCSCPGTGTCSSCSSYTSSAC